MRSKLFIERVMFRKEKVLFFLFPQWTKHP